MNASSAFSGTATPSWDAPTTNADGTPLTDLAGYKVYYGTSSHTYSQNIDVGNVTTYTVNNLTEGYTYYFAVTAYDTLRNESDYSTEVSKTITSSQDITPPSGSIEINNGVAYTESRDVTLKLSATDPSGVPKMCISNTTSCTSWTAYATSKSWTLPTGDGDKTVYVWFKDGKGNANTTPYSDSIKLDTTAPSGNLSATPGENKIDLNWSGFSDATSGIASYKLAFSTTGKPASCSTGVLYTGTGTSYAHTGLDARKTYYYRVCATDNAGNTSGATASAKPLDTTPPSSSIKINNDAAYTKSRNVTLKLSATDPSGVPKMCISNTTSCTSWTAYATSKSWTLPTGDGDKTVYVRYKDGVGNANATPYSDLIKLDTTAPSGSLSATPGENKIDLNWSGFSDATSGIASYKLAFSTTGKPTSCSTGVLYTGTGTSYAPTGLDARKTYYYRVCATDNAGNTSGATASAKPLDTTPPSGSMKINNDATYTKSRNVTLKFSATDPSGVPKMCISNTTSCTSWTAYAKSKSWTLPTGEGDKTVYVWFKDGKGNANTTPYSDSIKLDTTAPSGSLSATPGENKIDLNWSGFSDATSGIASYKLAFSTTGKPASCSTGVLYTGSATSYTHTGLNARKTYYYRLCATDNAGNTSGATASAKPNATITTAASTEASSAEESEIGSDNLPKTGQTVSYALGDDGYIQAGIEWPNPRFADNGDGTMTDNLTGLMWLKDGGCIKEKKWEDSLNAIADLNNNPGNYNCLGYAANYSDWYLPNVKELESLTNYGASDSAAWLNSEGFVDVNASYYWSSTTHQVKSSHAWLVMISAGKEVPDLKSNQYYVLPVRAGVSGNSYELPKTGQTISYAPGDDGYIQAGIEWPNPRFTDNGDGTMTDNLTGLMWLKDGGCIKEKKWEDSLKAIADLNNNPGNYNCLGYAANYSDWYLPNVKELESLTNYGASDSATWLNSEGFVDVNASYYWSSTTHQVKSSHAWLVMISAGKEVPDLKSNQYYVWPVRAGNLGR